MRNRLFLSLSVCMALPLPKVALAQAVPPPITAAGPDAPGGNGISGPGHLSPQEIADINRIGRAAKIARDGDADAERGDWAKAIAEYRQSLALWPDNAEAFYGLAAYSHWQGDAAAELADYRAAVYTHPAPPAMAQLRETDTDRLMGYVLLLSQGGQEGEALTVYRHAVDGLNFQDHRQNLQLLLPTFGPGQWAYTPARLQAMAQVAIATVTTNTRQAQPHLQQALQLAPDSPLPYFYLGRLLFKRNDPAARQSFAQARALGDATVAAAVDREMKLIH